MALSFAEFIRLKKPTWLVEKTIVAFVVDGQKLRVAREEKGMTMRALAQKIGVTPSYLCDLEHDRRNPSEDTAMKLFQALKDT